MNDCHKKADAALKAFKKGCRDRGWKRKNITAAVGGWEYVLDMTYSHKENRYKLSLMGDSNGESESYDMAQGHEELNAREREAIADYIFDGMTAARKFIEETYGED